MLSPSTCRSDLVVSLPDWVGPILLSPPLCTTDADKMRLAIELSRANVVHRTGGPFGAAVFEAVSGRLVAVGVNSVERLNNSVIHAEVFALMLAEAAVGSYSLRVEGRPEHELFTSCEPCAMCLGAILWSGIRRVMCAASRQDAVGIGFEEGPVFPESYRYLEERGVGFRHGYLGDEARAVFQLYRQRGGLVYNA